MDEAPVPQVPIQPAINLPVSQPVVVPVIKSKFNWSVIILSLCLVIALIFGGYYFGKSRSLEVAISVTPTQMLRQPADPSPTAEVVPTVETVSSGSVMGKLCYPSEMLPKGTIEAKNTTTNEVTVQDYPGSAGGGTNSYTFNLASGSYYLRYKTSADLIGYHTETCKTGSETSCTATNPRVLIPATVENGSSITDYDLCDFYYSESTKPAF